MALFRRPKKAVRPRVITINTDEDDDMDDLPAPEIINNNGNTTTTTTTTTTASNTTTISTNNSEVNKPIKISSSFSKKGEQSSKFEEKSSKKQTVLSFDDEFEGDDGEVFKVKKSSVSRRLIKQRDREKKSEGSSFSTSGGSSTFKTFQSHKISFGGFNDGKESSTSSGGIKNENSSSSNNTNNSKNNSGGNNKKSEDFIRILNGRDAVATTLEEEDMEDDHDNDDEDEEEDDHSDNEGGRVKFRNSSQRDAASEAVRIALEKGQIPDASLIHEARKRRQQARESGAAVDFIPVDNVQKYRGEKSRLVREDDNDRSGDEDEDEERLDFSTATNSAQIAREKRREAFEQAQDAERGSSAGETDEEMDEWERQQIRKGVTKTQMQNVATEVFQQQSHLYPNDYTSGSYFDSAYPSADVLLSNSSDISISGTITLSNNRTKNKNQQDLLNSSKNSRVLKVDDIVAGNKKLTPEIILHILGERLIKLKISKEAHEGSLSRMEADLNLADKELEEAKSAKPALSSRFVLYQNLRGYVTDLVDCLRCKVPQIETLENKMLELMKNQTDRLAERRRQDTKDQLEEVKATRNILGGTPVTVPPPSMGEAKTRRAAEREGRRTRRRRLREIKDFKGHKEGLSSDDEEMESELNSFKIQRDSITLEAQNLFRDVVEDFGTIEGILSHFEEWRDGDFDSYKESYAYLCVPKCLAPILRSYLLCWDPFTDDFSMNKFPWIKSLANFGYRNNETIENLTADPDSRIIPDVTEKIIIPWITRVVKAKWDPLSASQTKKLVNVVRRCIDEWSVIPTCKSVQALMSAIVSKFKDAVDNDVYIHLFPKQSGTNKCSPEYIFASRQFWSSVKLLDNMSSWAGLLSDKPLHILALDALLTRYILLGLRTAADLSDSAERAKGVVNVLPRSWLTREKGSEVPNGLLQLTNCLVSIVQNTDFALAVNRFAIPEIGNVLKSIGATTEAQLVIQKYS